MSSSSRRRVVVPVLAFVAVTGLTVALAEAHLARPGVPEAAVGTAVVLGDAYRGQTTFGQYCAACHGEGGAGGGIGPKLAGRAIPLALVKSVIDAGQGAMPPGLVKGGQEADVLAYVATLLATAER